MALWCIFPAASECIHGNNCARERFTYLFEIILHQQWSSMTQRNKLYPPLRAQRMSHKINSLLVSWDLLTIINTEHQKTHSVCFRHYKPRDYEP